MEIDKKKDYFFLWCSYVYSLWYMYIRIYLYVGYKTFLYKVLTLNCCKMTTKVSHEKYVSGKK